LDFVFYNNIIAGGGELEVEHSDGSVKQVQDEAAKCTAGDGG
jgi:hypothetical protein